MPEKTRVFIVMYRIMACARMHRHTYIQQYMIRAFNSSAFQREDKLS